MLNSDIKSLNDKIQGLQVARAKLQKPCPHTGRAAYEARQLQLAEIEADIQELKQQLQQAQGKAVAGAIGKGA
jgi:hypothetical protein